MTSYEFWEELNKIFNAVISYQEKSIEFNNRFITPWIRLGNVFDKGDKSREKIDAYKKSLEMDPTNVQNWVELGNLQMEANELEDALTAYRNVIALNPDLGWGYSNLGTVYMMMGKYEKAIENFQRGITLLPDDNEKALAWNRLGTLYRKTQQYDLALDAFRNADSLEIDCTAPAAMDAAKEGNMASAPIAENDQVSSVPEGLELVTSMPDLQQLSGANKHVQHDTAVQANRNMPADEGATIEIGSQYPDVTETSTDAFPVSGTMTLTNEPLLLDEMPGAEEDSRSLTVESNPPTESMLTDSVSTAPATDQQTEESPAPEEAAELGESVESLLELDPMITEIEEDLTVDSFEAELQEQAPTEIISENTYPESVSSEVEFSSEDSSKSTLVENEVPQLPEDLSLEAATVSEENTKVTGSREQAYEEYLLSENRLSMTENVQDTRNIPSATTDPVTIIDSSGDVQMEVDINNAKVWNELGNVYYNNGAIEDAVLAYAKSIELDRQFAWPYSNLALAYVQKDRFAEAILLYQRSIELFTSEKDKAIAWNRLGNVYRRMDDYENAISAYQRADELDPGNISLAVQSRYSLLGTLTPSQATVTS